MSVKVTKAMNNSESLYFEIGTVKYVARYVDFQSCEIWDNEGNPVLVVAGDNYEIAKFSSYGKMNSETFETVEELTAAMRKLQDLRKWRYC